MRRKDTKTHQKRRIALDADTVAIVREHLEQQDADAKRAGVRMGDERYLFSNDPDCARPWLPDSVSQRYDRLVTRLGIDTSLHSLRHYNATELLAAGVDLRTVAGRLGHAGGGATTLRVYAAWVTEADRERRQRSPLACRGVQRASPNPDGQRAETCMTSSAPSATGEPGRPLGHRAAAVRLAVPDPCRSR